MPSPRQVAQTTALSAFLTNHGVASSGDIQSALQLSQPTVSRILALLDDEVVVCGQGRSTRYALAQPVGNHAAQQPIWLMDEQGVPACIGTLSWLAKNQMHLDAPGLNWVFESSAQQALPWFLTPLRAQGFLGRLLAQRLAAQGVTPNPEQWDTETMLLAALHMPDAPGALGLGGALVGQAMWWPPAAPTLQPVLPLDRPGPVLDAVAQDVARTLPLGSSAGGEQPKFTVLDTAGGAWLVKFSPPTGTPFGERWADLLVAEALCSQVLRQHGHASAESHTVQTSDRTYLLSRRFDRLPGGGRRHVVSVGAAHAGFVPGPYVNWAATAQALVRQGRLSRTQAQRLDEQLQFGRLIGNSDMHAGNASLWVAGQTLHAISLGQFDLAPVYDMLPMRWRPDPMWGLPDYAPFAPDLSLVSLPVRRAAQDFWQALASDAPISTGLKAVAEVMAVRMGGG